MEISPVGTNFKDTDFVVYGFLRKDYSSFYYIGKGRPYRPHETRKRTIPHPGCSSRVVVLYSNVTEEIALRNEKILINLMGRIGVDPHGTLRNICPGGGGVSKKHSEYLKGKRWLHRRQELLKRRRNWFHSVIGEVLNLTPKELGKKFPEQDLKIFELNKVCKNKRDFYKGWRLLENITTPFVIYPVERDWYHPDFGEVHRKTYREVIDLDGRERFNMRSLRGVGVGKAMSYWGWRLLENKNKTSCRKGKKFDWYHPDHGIILSKACREVGDTYGLPPTKLNHVSCGTKRTYKGWVLLVNKTYVPLSSNKPKPRNWQHQEHGVVKEVSARELADMFPEQGLRVDTLREVGRGLGYSHKGWSVEGCSRAKPEEKISNWYHPRHGEVLGKTAKEIMEISDDKMLRCPMLKYVAEGKHKSTKGWRLATSLNKVTVNLYNPVERKTKTSANMRSKKLTKTVAITPKTYQRIAELKYQLRLRTYDDVLAYLLGEFQPVSIQSDQV